MSYVRVASTRGRLRELGGVGRAVVGLDGAVDSGGDGVLCDEVSIGELHFPGDAALDCLATAPGAVDAVR